MTDLISKRFAELVEQAEAIESSKVVEADPYSGTRREDVRYEAVLKWKVNAKGLIAKACGQDSVHLIEFTEAESGMMSTSLRDLKRMLAVFTAAKEDYDGGYLQSVESLVRAEVFSSELDQATELLNKGYAVAAAVIGGVVLETHLIALCSVRNIEAKKLEAMNVSLCQAGVYNTAKQKQVTALAAVRNSAAHGKSSEFNAADVKVMITSIENLVADFPA